MGTKSRETIYGASVRAAAERAADARREADRLAVEAWNKRMLGFKGPAQPSPTLGDALNPGYGYLEVRCLGCDTHQTVALDIVRRAKTTPVHELERYMRCKHCSELQGRPFKRSHLVALRTGKIFGADPRLDLVAGRALRLMARKLKTYITSVGFFDLAIAAPSMKAALEAWGSNTNLFHQGFAREVNEASVVEAALAKPGVVLRRPVGSNKPFAEDASLPTSLAGDPVRTSKRRERKERSPREIDQKVARKAALAYEKWRRDAENRKEEAAREKARQRRERAIEKVQAELDKAEREHTRRLDVIETERADIEARAQAEDARWHKRKSELEKALRRARS